MFYSPIFFFKVVCPEIAFQILSLIIAVVLSMVNRFSVPDAHKSSGIEIARGRKIVSFKKQMVERTKRWRLVSQIKELVKSIRTSLIPHHSQVVVRLMWPQILVGPPNWASETLAVFLSF